MNKNLDVEEEILHGKARIGCHDEGVVTWWRSNESYIWGRAPKIPKYREP